MPQSPEHAAYQPSARQQSVMAQIATRAVNRALEHGEYQALSLFDRVRSLYISDRAIQRAITDFATDVGVGVQTYYQGHQSALKYERHSPLMVRLITAYGEETYPPLQEAELLAGHNGRAIEVYPPFEPESDTLGEE